MTPVAFSVTEVRVAATCPRISYFDFEHTRRHRLKSRSVTRLWKAGAEETACGALFHNAVEAFNRRALDAPEVRATVEGESEPRTIERRLREFLNLHCVDLNALALRSVAQQQAFIRAVGIYMRELADIIGDARIRGKPTHEVLGQLFGDRRRRVDVTFQVGPKGEAVRITGILDYVFYDWRTAHHRIIDYKLTPAGEPSNDLFQVGLYALMHHVQHRTEPDVGVLYLHPDRLMVEMTWSQVHGQRHKLFDLLASMAEWQRYDEAGGKGLKPPGEPSCCSVCRWDNDGQCARRLGPKHEGHRLRHWTDAFAGGQIRDEPSVSAEEANGTPRAWAQAVETETEQEPGPTEMVSETTNAPGLQEGSKKAQTDGRTAGRSDQEWVATGEGVPLSTLGKDSAQIGTTIVGGRLVAIPVAALPTHVAVVGAAGSGKTWLAKMLAEEAIRLEIPVLAIDPQGDLVQFLRPAAEFPDLTPEEKALRRDFLDRVEPRVWTPGSSHGRRLCLDPIRLAKPSDLAHITDPIRRAEEWEGMLAVVAAQLVGTAKAGGETDSQQTFLLQALRSLAADPRGREVDLGTIAAVTSDPNSVGLENPDQFIKKSEREKLARKLNGLRLGPASNLYSGGQRLDLDAMFQPELAGKTTMNILYVNALTDDDQKHFFIAALAAEIYRWMISSPVGNAGRPRMLFYLDEARDYIPAGARKPPAKDPLVRLFTQGRKYGVACLLCTQSPRSVDYNVFGNCSTKLVGRLESTQDQDRVAEWFSKESSPPPWLAGRKGAEAGSFVGRWPFIQPGIEGAAFRSRRLFSLHEGAWSPDRLEQELRMSRAEGTGRATTARLDSQGSEQGRGAAEVSD